MISRKSAKKKPSNLHYRSARAIPSSLSSKGRDKFLSQRCKWTLIKGVILISGLGVFLGSLYLPFIGNEGYGNKQGDHSPLKTITGQLEEINAVVKSVENKVQNAVMKKVKDVKDGEDKNVDTQEISDLSRASLARGVSGLPMSETPSLIGAKRGHIECEVDVDQLVYWNSPQGDRDMEFKSPFRGSSGVSLSLPCSL